MYIINTVVLFATRHVKFVFAIMTVIFAQAVSAEPIDLSELSLEELLEVKVSAASKFDQTTADAPAAVQIISAEDIKRHGWHTLAEALNSLPGVYFVNDRTYDYLGARGFQIPGDYNTRFLLLTDGQRNNDNIYQQALVGSEGWVDMSVVDHIEYIPGPGSAIYGSNAMFGVINVVTRNAGKAPFNHVNAYASQLGQSGINVMSSRQLDDTGLLLQLSTEQQAGNNLTYTNPMGLLVRADGTLSPDGVAHGLDRGDNHHLLMRVDRAEWGMKLINHERTFTPSSAAYITVFDDPSLRINDGGTQLSTFVRHPLSESSDVFIRMAYTDWHFRGTYPYLNPTVGYYRNYDDTHGRVMDGELSYTLHLAQHHLVTGIEVGQDLQARQQNSNSVSAASLGTADVDINPLFRRRALFVQDEWRMAAHWLLSAGLRFDSVNQYQPSTSPRLGLIWQPDQNWNAKLLSGRAYRSPNAFESQFDNGITNLGNPDLQPEVIHTTEGVLEWKQDSRTRWVFSLFENYIEGVIHQVDTTGTGLLQFQNGSWARVQGTELGVEKTTTDSLRLRTSIASNSASNMMHSSQQDSPAWVGKFSLSAPLMSDSMLAAGDVHAIGNRNYIWGGSTYHAASEALVDVALTFPHIMNSGLKAQFRITNLFDHQVQYPASVEMPTPQIPGYGRNLSANISYEF